MSTLTSNSSEPAQAFPPMSSWRGWRSPFLRHPAHDAETDCRIAAFCCSSSAGGGSTDLLYFRDLTTVCDVSLMFPQAFPGHLVRPPRLPHADVFVAWTAVYTATDLFLRHDISEPPCTPSQPLLSCCPVRSLSHLRQAFSHLDIFSTAEFPISHNFVFSVSCCPACFAASIFPDCHLRGVDGSMHGSIFAPPYFCSTLFPRHLLLPSYRAVLRHTILVYFFDNRGKTVRGRNNRRHDIRRHKIGAKQKGTQQ